MKRRNNKMDVGVKLFALICNIPYGRVGLRDQLAMVVENRGSCSTKHALLSDLLRLVGFEVRSYIGVCDLATFAKTIPLNFKVSQPVRDFHNFLRVKTRSGWKIVDATFGRSEERWGLPNNLRWTGIEDCRLLFPVSASWEVRDIVEAKALAVEALPRREQELRAAFFETFEQMLALR